MAMRPCCWTAAGRSGTSGEGVGWIRERVLNERPLNPECVANYQTAVSERTFIMGENLAFLGGS